MSGRRRPIKSTFDLADEFYMDQGLSKLDGLPLPRSNRVKVGPPPPLPTNLFDEPGKHRLLMWLLRKQEEDWMASTIDCKWPEEGWDDGFDPIGPEKHEDAAAAVRGEPESAGLSGLEQQFVAAVSRGDRAEVARLLGRWGGQVREAVIAELGNVAPEPTRKPRMKPGPKPRPVEERMWYDEGLYLIVVADTFAFEKLLKQHCALGRKSKVHAYSARELAANLAAGHWGYFDNEGSPATETVLNHIKRGVRCPDHS